MKENYATILFSDGKYYTGEIVSTFCSKLKTCKCGQIYDAISGFYEKNICPECNMKEAFKSLEIKKQR